MTANSALGMRGIRPVMIAMMALPSCVMTVMVGHITHDARVCSHYGENVNSSGQLSGGGTKHRMMPLLGVQQAIAWPVGLSVRLRITSSGMVRQIPSICA